MGSPVQWRAQLRTCEKQAEEECKPPKAEKRNRMSRLSALPFAGSLLLLYFLAGCTPTPSPTTTSSNLGTAGRLNTAPGQFWVELTTGIIAPTSAGLDGQINVFGMGAYLFADSNSGAAAPGTLPSYPANCSTLNPNLACYGHWNNDQETVPLPNGDFLLSWNGYSAANPSQFSGAPWFNEWGNKTNSGPQWSPGVDVYPVIQRNGIRAAQLLWRYSAQTRQFSWAGALDMAYVGGTDPNGTQHSQYCVAGVPFSSYGMDRPELYVDQWDSQNTVYLSGGCTLPTDDGRQIWTSLDSGTTWRDSHVHLPNGAETAMTSTPSGVLYILQYGGASGMDPALFFSTDHAASLTKDPADLTQPLSFDIVFDTCGNANPCRQGGQMLPGKAHPPPASFAPNFNPLALAATGPDSVLAVYSAWTPAMLEGKIPVNQQVAAVVLVGGAPDNTFFPRWTSSLPACLEAWYFCHRSSPIAVR